jgi:ribosomal protein S18 acetylase RimI-like enzyme
VGVFDQGELVGFTMVGLDHFGGSNAAFDAGTGIVKPYRGQGLAKAMFDFIVPKLRAKGVERFYLEVIQSNEPAVRAYQKSGFTIARELDSFEIHFEETHLDRDLVDRIPISPVPRSDLEGVADFFDWLPSWENSLTSICRIPDEFSCFGAFVHGNLVGVLVHYPLLNWILNLAVHKSYRRQKIGTALLVHLRDVISTQYPVTRIINVEHTDEGMIKFLQAVGFEFVINQFEMKLDL